MDKVVVSIIIPVFNAAKDLDNCLKSVMSQTFQNYEVILVDDGSKDGSSEICDKWANEKDKIIVVHQVNAGANAARAKGVDLAKGEWITFVDADDTISPNYLSALYGCCEGTDIVCGRIEGEKSLPKKMHIVEARARLLSVKFSTAPYCKLYRKTLFDKHTFDIPREIQLGEDMIMNIRLFFNADRYPHFVNEVLYFYNHRETGLSGSYVSTIASESLVDESRRQSIPRDQYNRYGKWLTKGRLDGLFHAAKTDVKRYLSERSDSGYIRLVKKEAKIFGYRFSLDEYLLLWGGKNTIWLGLKCNSLKKVLYSYFKVF